MAKSLFSNTAPRTDLNKNVFDLSAKMLFSMSSGMLLPVFARHMNPGEKGQVTLSSFARTQPLNSAAFASMKVYYHQFFVPYKQLWSGWDNFFYGTKYFQSALQVGTEPTEVPTINLAKLLPWFVELSAGEREFTQVFGRDKRPLNLSVSDEFGFNRFYGTSRLLDMLRYGFTFDFPVELPQLDEQGQPTGTKFNNTYHIRSLSDMIETYIRLSQSEPRLPEWIEDEIVEDIIHSAPQWDNRDTDLARQDAYRILYKEVLRDGEYLAKLKAILHDGALATEVNLFALLAYQKIYQDFYRREDYEASRPDFYNIDDFDNTNAMDIAALGEERLLNMFTLRYRWTAKDYFHGIVPSELVNVEGSIKEFNHSVNLDLEDVHAFNKDNRDQGVGLNMEGNGTKGIFTMAALRAMAAIEKQLKLTRRASGFDYISQTAAHFGFEPPKGRGHRVEFLGGVTSQVNINEVLTTSNGTADVDGKSLSSVVGEVYGKGYASLGHDGKTEFTAKEHGIYMIVASVVPDLDYDAVGLDTFNVKKYRGDFFQPEFQDLGFQPVFGYELANRMYHDANNTSAMLSADANRHAVLGYVPRYAEYKTSYDTLHGEFRRGRGLASWSTSQTLEYNAAGVIVSTMKINPSALNRIFTVQYDGSEKTDQLMMQVFVEFKAIRPMSIMGQRL